MKNVLKHVTGTAVHKVHVARYILEFSGHLMWRALVHDLSKFGHFERRIFADVTPDLKKVPYGSAAYRDCLKALGPALEHHYASNRHHPEHFGTERCAAMNLVDVVEMVCDWKAATKRHADGNLTKSVKQNYDRFKLTKQLADIFINTAKDLDW